MTNDGDQKNTDSRATTSSSTESSVGTGGKRWFGMGVLLILVVGLGGWGSLSLSNTKKEPPKVHRVARGGVKVAVTEQGTLESFNNTEIK